MFTTMSSYPGDAIGGADFLSGAAQRTIKDVGIDGTESIRKEAIVVTDRYFDSEEVAPIGRACFSEQTIRSLGAAVGLVDRVTVAKLQGEIEHSHRRIRALKDENVRMKGLVSALAETEPIRTLYVTPDGTTHETPTEAAHHMANPKDLVVEVESVTPYQEA